MSVHPFKDFIAGGVGGVCTVASGFPFDTVKVRIQTQGPNPIYSGAYDCFLKTVRNEGFFGLYKGMGAPIVGVTPMFAICFAGYSVGKKLQGGDKKVLNMFEIFNAGMLAGVCTTVIMAPGERIKCLLQVQTKGATQKYNGPIDCVKQLYKEGGIRSIFKGTGATLARGIFFAIDFF